MRAISSTITISACGPRNDSGHHYVAGNERLRCQ